MSDLAPIFVGDTRVDGPTPRGHGDQLRLGQLAAILSIVVSGHDSTITDLSREVETVPADEG